MKTHQRSAFTLVELLVVIAIIGTLVALLLPAVQSAREAARRNSCVNNLKQQMMSTQLHHDTKNRYMMGRETSWQQGVSWAFHILPFIEMKNVFDSFVPELPVFDEANSLAMRTPVEIFYCPSRRSPAADRDFDNNDQPSLVQDAAAGGDYAANAGHHYRFGTEESDWTDTPDMGAVAGPIFTRSKISARQVLDGLSQTFAIGERHIPWEVDAKPGLEDHDKGDNAFFAADNPDTILAGTKVVQGQDPSKVDGYDSGLAQNSYDLRITVFGSEHSQVVNFAFLDGHVSPIAKSIDQETLELLSTIADGRVIDSSEL